MTQALGTFGVMAWPRDEFAAVLDLANDFRRALVEIEQERHDRTILLRNDCFPSLFAALAESERAYARIAEIERDIKALHSDERNRNVVTDEQEAALKQARERYKHAKAAVSECRQPWNATLSGFRLWWQSCADWKNVKSLDSRRKLYAALAPPDSREAFAQLDAASRAKPRPQLKGKPAKERKPLDASLIDPGAVAAYAALWMELDLRERELYSEFQSRGLHSAIRAEIVEASQPKLTKDGPGIRYRFGRGEQTLRELRPWEKVTVQFGGGGLPVAEAMEGTPAFSLEKLWVNHTRGGTEVMCRATQQIGTASHPRLVTYKVRLHRELPETAVLKRWSVAVRDSDHVTEAGNRVKKAYAIPLVDAVPAKPRGTGLCGYRLRWTVRKSCVEIAHVFGLHVNERVILPAWLVDNRMAVSDEQARADALANRMLASRGASPATGERQGMEALAEYAAKFPRDNGVANVLASCREAMLAARKIAKRAERTIGHIYRTVAHRVCSRHGSVWHDPLDLKNIKRYDTRDLLVEDVLPARAREILHAVAPGKLRAAMKAYGLPASGEVPTQPPGDARETDLCASYVASLARITGRRELPARDRSHCDAQGVPV